MKTKTVRIITIISTFFLGLNFLTPLTTNASTDATIGQHLDRGDFSIDTTPSSFSFTAINITSPDTVYKSYYNGYTGNNRLKVHDGRYAGGIRVTVQATSYDPGTPADPTDDIAASNLAVLTSNDSFSEVLKSGTPAMSAPLNGDPSADSDYTSFTSPIVILDGAGGAPSCSIGRVGTYTTFPSFRLTIPNATPAGTYSSTITYDLMEAPLGC